MPSKGIELPVNAVIIIALAIFVLLMLAAFFGKSVSELDQTQVNTAFKPGAARSYHHPITVMKQKCLR